MIKNDGRKLVEIKIKLRLQDLEKWEDFNDCIPLCKKHNLINGTKYDLDLPKGFSDFAWMKCKDCKKVRNNWEAGMQRIYCQCWKQISKKLGW